MNRFRGFTLIELIVVMGILAILATIVVIAVNPGRQFAASRNAKRANDTRAIVQALDQYAANNNGNAYASITTTPQNIGTGALDLTSILVPNYLSAIPKDPQIGTDADTEYVVFKDVNERVSVVATSGEIGKTIGYGTNPNLAAQFVWANNEYLSVANNTSVQTGGDFWISTWVLLDSLTGNTLVSKGTFSGYNNADYSLEFTTGGYYFRFTVGTGSSSATVTDATARTTGTWYHVLAWYDAAAGSIRIQVNNGAVTSAVLGAAPIVTTQPMIIGAWPSGSNAVNGRLDNVAFGKAPSGGIASIISAMGSSLYNNGRGKDYSQLTSGEKTSWGMVSWWNLDEDSGTRRDAHGANHLTDNNTVTDAPGV